MKFSQFPSNVRLRIICGFFDHAAGMSVMPFMVLYIADELGKVASGILLSLNVIFGLICGLCGGYFADRFSRKGQLVAGQLLFAVLIVMMTIFIHPAINQPWLVTLFFMLTAVSNAMIFPALEALIIDSTTEEMRKSVYVTTYWTNNLATAIGTAIGGLFYKDYRIFLFICIIIIMLINTVIFKRYLIDPTVNKVRKVVETHWVRDLLSSYRVALKDRRFVVFTTAMIFVFSAEFALTNYIGVHLHNTFKPIDLFGIHVDGVRMMSILLIENTLLVVSITFLVSKLTERRNQVYVLLLGTFLYTAGYGLAHYLTTWYLLVIVIFFATVGELMQTPIISVFQAKLMPEDKRASYIAFSSLGYSGAGLVASSGLIIGVVLNSMMMSIYVIIMGLIGMLLFYLAVHTHIFKQPIPE
ncbi:MFS transporter [Macrococcus brunensis]|uniref:MFS transporter n=1 Tax=Macrococcus brunensis TaxID=198483 RepID=A0A4R6BER2_9STAP|nr:MFS transporter [Macrococcus brunensis]TDL98272.1 MFS transporter [Macrococcus brunensis]